MHYKNCSIHFVWGISLKTQFFNSNILIPKERLMFSASLRCSVHLSKTEASYSFLVCFCLDNGLGFPALPTCFWKCYSSGKYFDKKLILGMHLMFILIKKVMMIKEVTENTLSTWIISMKFSLLATKLHTQFSILRENKLEYWDMVYGSTEVVELYDSWNLSVFCDWDPVRT